MAIEEEPLINMEWANLSTDGSGYYCRIWYDHGKHLARTVSRLAFLTCMRYQHWLNEYTVKLEHSHLRELMDIFDTNPASSTIGSPPFFHRRE